jgi:hypothetical protein
VAYRILRTVTRSITSHEYKTRSPQELAVGFLTFTEMAAPKRICILCFKRSQSDGSKHLQKEHVGSLYHVCLPVCSVTGRILLNIKVSLPDTCHMAWQPNCTSSRTSQIPLQLEKGRLGTWSSHRVQLTTKFLLNNIYSNQSVPHRKHITSPSTGSNKKSRKALLTTSYHAGFLLGLIFETEDRGDIFLRNVGWLSTDYTALYPRR